MSRDPNSIRYSPSSIGARERRDARRSPTEPDPRDWKGAVPLLQRDLVALSLARCPDKRTA